MKDGWNFHGWIAVPLERYGHKYIGDSFFSADEIATGAFVEAMLQILSAAYGNLDKVCTFVEQCNLYQSQHDMSDSNECAMTLFREFENLLRLYENIAITGGEKNE